MTASILLAASTTASPPLLTSLLRGTAALLLGAHGAGMLAVVVPALAVGSSCFRRGVDAADVMSRSRIAAAARRRAIAGVRLRSGVW